MFLVFFNWKPIMKQFFILIRSSYHILIYDVMYSGATGVMIAKNFNRIWPRLIFFFIPQNSLELVCCERKMISKQMAEQHKQRHYLLILIKLKKKTNQILNKKTTVFWNCCCYWLLSEHFLFFVNDCDSWIVASSLL